MCIHHVRLDYPSVINSATRMLLCDAEAGHIGVCDIASFALGKPASLYESLCVDLTQRSISARVDSVLGHTPFGPVDELDEGCALGVVVCPCSNRLDSLLKPHAFGVSGIPY